MMHIPADHFVYAAPDLDLLDLRQRAAAKGAPLGRVRSASRERSDGVKLSWSPTDPDPDRLRLMLRQVDLDVAVVAAAHSTIVAGIDGGRGIVELR